MSAPRKSFDILALYKSDYYYYYYYGRKNIWHRFDVVRRTYVMSHSHPIYYTSDVIVVYDDDHDDDDDNLHPGAGHRFQIHLRSH